MRKSILVLPVVALLGLSGCANLNQHEQRMLTGGAIGAGAGTLGAWIIGAPLIAGAGVGAAAGAVVGHFTHQKQESRQ